MASSWSESLPGLLISPARGLVWFSPVLVLGFLSAAAVWRNPRYRALIPLQLGGALMILAAGKWFDWWGGLTWGYRSIVDAAPFLALLMIPIVERIVASRPLRVLCGVLLVWSITVQFVGAYSYSLMGWSDLWRDYDRPEQASPWRWDRPQIGYHLANFSSERAPGPEKASNGNLPEPPRTDPQRAQSSDTHTLLLPHRPGNNQIGSLQNVVEQPRVGLLFFVPGMNETLRARATVGARQAADFRAARHRGRGVPALAQIARASIPTYRQVLADQIAGVAAEPIDASEDQENRNQLYCHRRYRPSKRPRRLPLRSI